MITEKELAYLESIGGDALHPKNIRNIVANVLSKEWLSKPKWPGDLWPNRSSLDSENYAVLMAEFLQKYWPLVENAELLLRFLRTLIEQVEDPLNGKHELRNFKLGARIGEAKELLERFERVQHESP